jgi:hypothetical protein
MKVHSGEIDYTKDIVEAEGGYPHEKAMKKEVKLPKGV